jgi:hypothetical protein
MVVNECNCRNIKIHTTLPWLIWFQRVQSLWEEALVNLFFLGLGIGYVHSIAADM